MKKADHVHRAIAKTIDFLMVALVSYHSWIGVLTGALYIAISDGFFKGQSVGKKLIGLRVMVRHGNGALVHGNFRDSIIRNILFSFFIVLSHIPIIGWFIFLPIALVFVGIEAYFIYFDDAGIRIGDIFAASRVVDVEPDEKA